MSKQDDLHTYKSSENPSEDLSRRTNHFNRLFRRLPKEVQRKVECRLEIFKRNPECPKLRFKKLTGHEAWSIRIDGYRAIAFKDEKGYFWHLVGTRQSIYDLLNSKRY